LKIKEQGTCLTLQEHDDDDDDDDDDDNDDWTIYRKVQKLFKIYIIW